MTNKLWRLDKLYEIGTPDAAVALAQMIWTTDDVAYHAAWHLASIFVNSGVEEALQNVQLPEEQMQYEKIEWVWAPFISDEQSVLEAITGRLAYLLDSTPTDLLSQFSSLKPDVRLVIPLCAVAAQKTKLKPVSDETRQKFQEKDDSRIISTLSDDSNWQQLIKSLPQNLRLNLLNRLIDTSISPTENDWRNIFAESEYQFIGSWHAKAIKLLFITVLSLGFIQQSLLSAEVSGTDFLLMLGGLLFPFSCIVYLFTTKIDSRYLLAMAIIFILNLVGYIVYHTFFETKSIFETVEVNMMVASVVGMIVSMAILLYNKIDPISSISRRINMVGILSLGVVIYVFCPDVSNLTELLQTDSHSFPLIALAVIALFIIIMATNKESDSSWIDNQFFMVSGFIVIVALISPIVYHPTQLLFSLGWVITIGFWLAWFVIYILLMRRVRYCERLALNPLDGLLDKQGQAVLQRQRQPLFRLNKWSFLQLSPTRRT